MDLTLIDKLRLLNLDTEFRHLIKMKPMSRYYFVSQTNPGEQFYVFVSMSAWLIRKCGEEFEPPQEDDDPNSTIASILDYLRQKEVPVEFSPHKLKQGFGDQVIYILNNLADDALRASEFKWQKPEISEEGTKPYDELDETDLVEDESEILLDKVEEDMMELCSDDSDNGTFDENGMNDGGRSAPTLETSLPPTKPPHDPESWKLELERVTPALRLKISADGRDWRTRHTQMMAYRDELTDKHKSTGTQLSRLHGNISTAMDKVQARETILNEQFEGLVREYGSLQDEQAAVNQEYKSVSGGVTERQAILNDLNSRVDALKLKTEYKGTSINDNSPLLNARKAVDSLKKEIQEMDYVIAVLLWSIGYKSAGMGSGGMESKMTIDYF